MWAAEIVPAITLDIRESISATGPELIWTAPLIANASSRRRYALLSGSTSTSSVASSCTPFARCWTSVTIYRCRPRPILRTTSSPGLGTTSKVKLFSGTSSSGLKILQVTVIGVPWTARSRENKTRNGPALCLLRRLGVPPAALAAPQTFVRGAAFCLLIDRDPFGAALCCRQLVECHRENSVLEAGVDLLGIDFGTDIAAA